MRLEQALAQHLALALDDARIASGRKTPTGLLNDWSSALARRHPRLKGSDASTERRIKRLLSDIPIDGRVTVEFHDRSSEEHTSELQSLMRNSYAVFCLKKKNLTHKHSFFFYY